MVGLAHDCHQCYDCQQNSNVSQRRLVLTPLQTDRAESITGNKRLSSQTDCPNCWPSAPLNSVEAKTCETQVKAQNVVFEENESTTNWSQRTPSVPKSSTSLGTIGTVNYVNMNFVQSIPLYENIEFVQSRQQSRNVQSNDNPIERSGENETNSEALSEANDKSMDHSDYVLMQPIISCEKSFSERENQKLSTESVSLNSPNQRNIETANSDNGLNNGIQSVSKNQFNTRLKYRSHLSDKRKTKDNNFVDLSADRMSCPSSPALTSRSPVCEMSLQNREKSFSIDDVSNAKSDDHNKQLRLCSGLLTYKSADCLKERFEDYRSSDEDLCSSSQITVLCNTPLTSPLRADKTLE